MTISPDLPEVCYVFEPAEKPYGICAIKRGQKGFYPVKDYPHGDAALVDRLNEKLGVTSAQREAMRSGSMFGWNLPIADPKTWEKAEAEGPKRAKR